MRILQVERAAILKLVRRSSQRALWRDAPYKRVQWHVACTNDGEAVGYAKINTDSNEILRVWVSPPHRGFGYSTYLLNGLQSRFDYLSTYTLKTNTPMRRALQRAGFRRRWSGGGLWVTYVWRRAL